MPPPVAPPARLALYIVVLPVLVVAACQPATPATVSAARRAAIADSLQSLIAAAYDFSKPGVVERLTSLYPERGPVISATSGRVTATREALEAGIDQFWTNVGQNMREPRWEWRATYVEVVSPDAAVLTGSYRIPHRTPSGEAHLVGGAWTALFVRRDGRWVIVQEHLSDLSRATGARDEGLAR
ncbi:MAG: DUF4440 domain-containing protein [Gemmatimonadota bacterium]|nr:DUF4440 domain-containing protein [Gemmatimonadota bacterium]